LVKTPYLNLLNLSRIHYSQWENGFRGVVVNIEAVNQRIFKLKQLQAQILAKLPNIAPPSSQLDGSKGWTSSKLISAYLVDNFPRQHLTPTPSGIYFFDDEARLKLLQKHPDNQIIKLFNDFKKKEKTITYLTSIQTKSHQGVLQYDYQTCGTATGRFTTSRPPFHNFPKRPPNPKTLTLQEEI